MTPESARPWIRTIRPEARLRLLCFPYAGGGTVEYRAWEKLLPTSIDVCPVILPGRETRLTERPYQDIRVLVRDLARDLAPVLNAGPVAFSGHSMGAWIAFELARELRRLGRPLPAHLFLSARRAPQLPDLLPKLHDLPDAQFIDRLQDRYNAIPKQILAEPSILAMFMPALRGDFTLLDTYTFSDEPPLAVPITALAGTDDRVVQRHEVAAWEAQAAAGFRLWDVTGGHFFLRDAKEQVCGIVAGVLRDLG